MAGAEQVIMLSADAELVHTNCTACLDQFEAGDEIVICPRCKSAHHADCWRAAAGCTKHGCPQVAVTLKPQPKNDLGDSRYLQRTPFQKALVIIGVVLAVGVLVFAAGSGPDPAQGKTKLSIMVPGGILETAYYDDFVKEFNESHPEHYLSVFVTPTIAYDQKLVVLLGARDAPDIFSLWEDRFHMLAEHGGLLELTSFIKPEDPFLESLPIESVRKVNGVVYGLAHPERNEVFGIWSLSPNPELAWKLMKLLFTKLIDDWPDELKQDLPDFPEILPMPGGLGGF